MSRSPTPRLAERDAAAPLPADLAAVRDRVLRAVIRVCPAWLSAQRDDLVQNAFLRVLPEIGRPDGPPPESHVRRAAYCALVDEIRRVRARREDSLEDPYSYARGEGSSPEEVARSRELGHEIRECLGHLVADRRRAVTLHLSGHSVAEIAALLGWDAKRTENLVGRGRSDMRACLERKGLEP